MFDLLLLVLLLLTKNAAGHDGFHIYIWYAESLLFKRRKQQSWGGKEQQKKNPMPEQII